MATTDERRQADEASQDAAGAAAAAHRRQGQPGTAAASALVAAARCLTAYEGTGLPEVREAWLTAMTAWQQAACEWTRVGWDEELRDHADDVSGQARWRTAEAVRMDADAERARWS